MITRLIRRIKKLNITVIQARALMVVLTFLSAVLADNHEAACRAVKDLIEISVSEIEI